jgi:hypothetical protein
MFELARSVTIVRYLKPRTKSSECCLEIRNSQIISFVLFLCDGRRSGLLGYPHSSYHLSSSRRKYSYISSAIFCYLYLILPHPPSLMSHISSQLSVVGLIRHTNTTTPLSLSSLDSPLRLSPAGDSSSPSPSKWGENSTVAAPTIHSSSSPYWGTSILNTQPRVSLSSPPSQPLA